MGAGGPVDELRVLNGRFIHNFVTNDVASHDEILHERFVCIRSDGARVERGPYLEAWASGFDPEVIVYWDYRDESIDVFGDVALVRSTNKHTVVSGGAESVGMTTYTDTYVREGDRWLCVRAQLTTVAPDQFPSDESIVRRYVRGEVMA